MFRHFEMNGGEKRWDLGHDVMDSLWLSLIAHAFGPTWYNIRTQMEKKSGKIKQILCTSWGGHIYKSKWYSNTIIWQQFWDQNDHLLGLLCILFSCNHIQSFSNGLKATKTRFGTTFPRKCRSTRDWLLSLWHPVIRTAMPAFHLALPDRLKQVHIYVLRSNFKFYSSSEWEGAY